MQRQFILTATLALLVTASAAAQTVTLTIDSPQDAVPVAPVAPGGTIDWTISFTVSSGDNVGLALLSVDLIQNAGNPGSLDLPAGAAVPAGMSNFSRPDGMSNPGESIPVSGYTGVQRGTPGQLNLVQIGGAQNTFGQALAGGSGVAENATVAGGVGQSGSQVLATGSFNVPSDCGVYTFDLANVVANALVSINTPPAFSPVSAAAIVIASGSFSVEVRIPGDLDGDMDVDLGDLAVMLSNFGTPSGAVYEDGDLNGDGAVDLSDLALQLSNFGSVCP